MPSIRSQELVGRVREAIHRRTVVVSVTFVVAFASFLVGAPRNASGDGWVLFSDDFSTDQWTDFSGDGTYDVFVDTSAAVLRFNSECGDRDFSYREIGPRDRVTVEFTVRVSWSQNSGKAYIGLVNLPDSYRRGMGYQSLGVPLPIVTDALVLVIAGPHWMPNGVPRIYSAYKMDTVVDVPLHEYYDDVGFDYQYNTNYYVRIVKDAGRGIVELWDSGQTLLLFRKDWGDVGLRQMPYVLVSDGYIGSPPGYGWSSADRVSGSMDNLVVSELVTEVGIDIKPGSFPNSINVKSNGKVPVAILTTPDFDAGTVDWTTVTFGPSGAPATKAALEDVDGDGDLDMVLHFNTQQTGIACGQTSATLKGRTLGGLAIEGTDSIKPVPCG